MKFLHTMLRVGNLQKSKDFYTDVLQMKVLREKEYPSGEFTLCFLGFEDESQETALELTYNWGKTEYELGTAFGHLAFLVKDIYAFCEEAKKKGVSVIREPGPMKHGTTVLAFIEDPDGYKIELIEKK